MGEDGRLHNKTSEQTGEQGESRTKMVEKILELQGRGKSNATTPVNKTTLNPRDIPTGRSAGE